MLRRSPRAALLWCLATVVAVATALTVGGSLASLRRQDARFGRVVELAVAAHDLRVGTTVAEGDVRTVRARGGALPPGAITSRRTAAGRVVAVPVLRGQPVTGRHLANRDRTGTDGVVAPGRRVMRVTVDDAPRLRPGDHVDVYVTFDPAQVPPDVDPTLVVAGAVPVLSIDTPAAATDGARRTGITLMLRTRDAPRVAYASANGVLAVAVVPPEDTPSGSSRRIGGR
jgi:Flp pilus assembly protein CpaB